MDTAFTHGVLMVWKSRVAYCNAVLCYNERINLDGSPSGFMVDDAARAMATQQLAMIAARKAAKQAKEAAWAAQNPPAPEPTPEPTPVPLAPPEPEPQVEVIETPEQLRAHLRASAKAAGAASVGPSGTVTQPAFPFRVGLSSTDLHHPLWFDAP